MNLYLLSQNKYTGWDVYDSCVVAAETPTEAANTYPDADLIPEGWPDGDMARNCWPSPKYVKVQYIGVAAPDVGKGVICASFNAG